MAFLDESQRRVLESIANAFLPSLSDVEIARVLAEGEKEGYFLGGRLHKEDVIAYCKRY